MKRIRSIGILVLIILYGGFLAHAATDDRSLTLYKLNSQIVLENDPIWALAREDSAAGALGRLGISVYSGLDLLRTGYQQQMGLFLLRVYQADVPGGPGVRSSIECPFIKGYLKLDLTNDTSLENSGRQMPSANLLLHFRY